MFRLLPLLRFCHIASKTLKQVAETSGIDSHHAFDSLWKQKALIDGIHGVIRLYITVFLQQDWPSVQSIISPKDSKSTLFVTMNKSPKNNAIMTMTKWPIPVQ